jgi:hypothetical protein
MRKAERRMGISKTFSVKEWTTSTDLDPVYRDELRYDGEDFADAMTMLLKLFNDGKTATLTARGIK